MKESGSDKIQKLIDRFKSNLKVYKSKVYKEYELRKEFVDSFFECLGWDVYNKRGDAPQYRDVIHEDSIKIGGETKAPDYCFTLSGRRMFFVETKKPSIDIKKDSNASYQLRRYSWSSTLPLSILTNFEYLAVYESKQKPRITDNVAVERIMLIPFTDYVEKWDEIYNIFSYDAVRKGSFDKFIESAKKKHGTQQLNSEFLKEIENWREKLAKNVALRNPDISVKQLNTAVQRTIDRVIFLRMCEDRSMEKYGQLRSVAEKEEIYKNLCQIYIDADEKYNSGLFHFKKEKNRETLADEFTLDLVIDDNVLKSIFRRLYYPNSPYEFSVISTEILGNIYEQFLGKVIRLTEGHRAKIEEKPEVKSAGGVFYTPQYIVDYIVENTVGNLCKGKTPKQILKIKILDPACGSGSFLLGAYSYLLKFHLDYYSSRKDPKRYKDQIYQVKEGEWVLTIKEKKRILLNNIYGVDIDTQAVEVTKLSLLLKVLEGERRDVFEKQQKLFKERALPDLGKNIKCGNSITGPDFFESDVQTSLLNEEEPFRVNAFDWYREFPEIIKSGGFDVIIGNPPYVDIKTLPNKDVRYIFNTYKSANNRVNLFAVFIEKSLTLIKNSLFRFSMIVPTAILTQESYKELRQKILNEFQIDSVARTPNESFGSAAGDVKVDTVILVIRNKGSRTDSVHVLGYKGYGRIYKIDPATAHVKRRINQSFWDKSKDNVWSINTTEKDEKILRKCEKNAVDMEKCVDFSLGLTPYDKYKGHTKEQINNRVFHADFKKNDTYKKLLAGNDVMRYFIKWNGEEWISYGPWLGAPREQRFFTEKRILVKQIIDWTTKRIWATITDEELYNTQNAFNLLSKDGRNLEFILGVLNSKLMTYYHKKRFLDEFKMRFQKILIKDCKRFPIYNIDLTDKNEKAVHDRIVNNVSLILELQEKCNEVKEANEKTILKRRIDAVDDQIDKIVFELYGLTNEEIIIVEKSLKE